MVRRKSRTYDEVISRILVELDKEQSTYQEVYRRMYGQTDATAKHIYQRLVGLCERIRDEIIFEERK